MPEPADPGRCPLCGGPNACALAGVMDALRSGCWCASRRFDAALLARVPAESRGRACICRGCQQAAAPAESPA